MVFISTNVQYQALRHWSVLERVAFCGERESFYISNIDSLVLIRTVKRHGRWALCTTYGIVLRATVWAPRVGGSTLPPSVERKRPNKLKFRYELRCKWSYRQLVGLCFRTFSRCRKLNWALTLLDACLSQNWWWRRDTWPKWSPRSCFHIKWEMLSYSIGNCKRDWNTHWLQC